MSAYGEMARQARRERHWPLRLIADRLGCSIAYVSGIERGDRNPPPSEQAIREWATLLDQDVDAWIAVARTARQVQCPCCGHRFEPQP